MPSPDHSQTQPNPLERRLAEFFDLRGAGGAPTAEAYAAGFADERERQRFLDALQQLEFAERHLPRPLESHTVLSQRYELLEAIGCGGMGQVWRAHDRKLGHDVAIKVLNLLATTALDVDRLVEREGRLLARLSHPGVVHVQDVGRDGDHRFLVMELVGGVALDEIIDRLRAGGAAAGGPTASGLLDLLGPAEPGRVALLQGDESWPVAVARVLVELLRTLEATHGVGIVHRDLKPGNVRLRGGGAPVLLDFGMGLANGSSPGRLTGGMFGTACYCAPEQWIGAELVGVHTDVYQAGVVLYELLTLERCFQEGSPAELMHAIRDGRFRPPRTLVPGLDPRLEACILHAMDVEPGRRYRSARAFREDLERFLAGDLPHAAEPLRTWSWRLRASVRRHRRGLMLGAAAGLGAMVVLAWPAAAGPRVQFGSGGSLVVELSSPAMMLAFRVARDADGAAWCAPVELRTGGDAAKAALAQPLPAGASDVTLADVGDATRVAASIVSTVFVDAADDAAKARFERLLAAMQKARTIVEDRLGAWLSEAEFMALLQPARGGGAVALEPAELLAPGVWQRAGLRGIVLAR